VSSSLNGRSVTAHYEIKEARRQCPARGIQHAITQVSITGKEIPIDSERIVSYDNAEIDFTTPAKKREKPCLQTYSADSG